MSSNMKIALVAVLVAASASSAFAANNKKAAHRASPRAAVTDVRSVPVAAPSAAEQRWMDRASLPSTY